MLFYVPPDTDISPSAILEFETLLRRTWHPHLNLFLCPQNNKFAEMSRWQRELASIFTAMTIATGPEQIEAFENCLARQPSLILGHRLSSMIPALLTHKKLPPIFFDLDDIEHIKMARTIKYLSNSPLAPLNYLKIPAIFWAEYQAIRLADHTFVCSNVDRNYLTHKLRLRGVVNLPNAVNVPAIQPITSDPTILFLGGYGYLPNIEAANFLVEQIWPYISSIMPEASLIIAGGGSERLRSYGKGVAGVEFTGFVEDLEALYRRSRIVCCPIFAGGGTRVKIIEAAAYGKPIVANAIAIEGINLKNGREFIQCETLKQFSEACLKLLKDDHLCEQLGASARLVATQQYDREAIVEQIRQIIKDLMSLNYD
jgi:glycosyltransferase involved in cell wall biosynthesis